ncbi:YbjQ family protein [Rubrivirga sp.]|uniref:YbjQ family protein n=1 Tax=Rubrivirga sp. TaxID=1885344 RepID=UPI003B52A162
MIRNRNVVATTTATLEGYETKAYLGVVSAHVVAGTGLFSDVFALFSDIFGGRSRSYQKQLAAINDEAIELLKSKAVALGANCVLGLRLDHDEIAGGGKSMFMVTATGTAAVTERSSDPQASVSQTTAALSADELDVLSRRDVIVQSVQKGKFRLDESTWEFIISNQVSEVAPTVLTAVERSHREPYAFGGDFQERATAYFMSLPDAEVKQLLHPVVRDGTDEMRKFAVSILSELNLLDLDAAEEMLVSDDFEVRKHSLPLLRLHKSLYSPDDAERFDRIREQVETSFDDRGKIVEVDQVFSSKTKQKWECECGAVNAMEDQFCPKCQHDISGFKQKEIRPDSVVRLLAWKSAAIRRTFDSS